MNPETPRALSRHERILLRVETLGSGAIPMRIFLTLACACACATCTFSAEPEPQKPFVDSNQPVCATSDGEKPLSVEQGDYRMTVSGLRKNVRLGEVIHLACSITWLNPTVERYLPKLKRLAGDLEDESFETREKAEASMSELLGKMKKEDAIQALRRLSEGRNEPEARSRLGHLKETVLGQNAEDGNLREGSSEELWLNPRIHMEIAPRSTNSGEQPRAIEIFERTGANPFIGAVPSLAPGESLDMERALPTRVPPGDYQVRFCLMNLAKYDPEHREDLIVTPWQPLRVDAHLQPAFQHILKSMPDGWTCASLVQRSEPSLETFESYAALPGWSYAGPLDLYRLLQWSELNVTIPLEAVELVFLPSWSPPKQETGCHFETRARLFRVSLDCEVEPCCDRPTAQYLGAMEDGRYFLEAEGTDAPRLVEALKRFCSDHAAQPIRRERDGHDLEVCLRDRCRVDEVLDWLYDLSDRRGDLQYVLLRHPAMKKAFAVDAKELSDQLGRQIELDPNRRDFLPDTVVSVGGEAYLDLLLRLMQSERLEVRRRALEILSMHMKDGQLAANQALARVLKVRAAAEAPELGNLLLEVLGQHEAYCDAAVPVLVCQGLRDHKACFSYILERRFGGEAAWECSHDQTGLSSLDIWWKKSGCKRAWPDEPWLQALADRTYQAKKKD